MGIVMVTIWFPPNKAIDVAKMYLKLPREIPFVTKWRVFNTVAGKDGSKTYHLIYTEKGKLEEASTEIMKYFVPMSNEIEGFRIQIEHLLGTTESYKLFGMEWK